MKKNLHPQQSPGMVLPGGFSLSHAPENTCLAEYAAEHAVKRAAKDAGQNRCLRRKTQSEIPQPD